MNAGIKFPIGNREWPCSECLRRGTSHFCPTGIPCLKDEADIPTSRSNCAARDLAERQSSAVAAGTSAAHSASDEQEIHASPITPITVAAPLQSSAPQPWTGVTESVGQLTWKKGGNSRVFGLTAADHLEASGEQA